MKTDPRDPGEQLRSAFDPDRHMRPVTEADVLGWIDDADSADAEPSNDRLPIWRRPALGMVLAAAAGVVVGFGLFRLVTPEPQLTIPYPSYSAQAPTYISAGEAFANAETDGFIPGWTCEPEEFDENLRRVLGGFSLPVAQLPPSVQLLGWSVPENIGGPLMDPAEIVLLAESDTGPRLLFIAVAVDARDPNLDVPAGLHVRETSAGALRLVEVSANPDSLLAEPLSAPTAP